MGFLRNLKLRSKLSVGFGAILLIMVCVHLIGYIGLKRVGEDFSHYHQIYEEATIAGRVQAGILEGRIAFRKFRQSGDRTQFNVFEDRYSQVENFLYKYKENVKDTDKEKKIDYISEYSKEYRDGFIKVLAFKEKRDDIYNQIIKVKGFELEKNLSSLMETSYGNNNEALHYGAANALSSLMAARLHSPVFFEKYDPQEKEKAKTAFLEMDKWLQYCLQSAEGSKLKQVINTVIADKEIYTKGLGDLVSITEESNKIIDHIDELAPKISALIEEIKLANLSENEVLILKVNQSINEAVTAMLSIIILALLLSVLITIFIVRIVATPVKTVTNTFQKIAEGDADFEVRLEVNSADEIGDMAKYFNQFMVKLQTVMLYNKNQRWLKAGLAELNEKSRGEKDVESLSAEIITYISKYLNAQIGAIYTKTEDNLFILLGSYAYKSRQNFSAKIEISDGLMGQAALEKQSIVITNVPDNYIKITSGIGESVPKNILLTPCVVNNKVKYIIELGSFNGFDDIQLEFIKQISDSIAISIQSAELRMKMQELLDKTLEQAEELQVQQEELRQSNEELAEQARALKESETRLQSQQAELMVINEELEERTKSLEMEHNYSTRMNEDLRKSQKEIEEKAKALKIASTYKSEFLANVSHELRTPLNSIMVLSQMLAEKKDNSPLTDKQLEYAKTINSSGEDLLKLIEDILDLSKVEAGKMDVVVENLKLGKLVQYIESSFRPIAMQKGLDFTINLEKGTPEEIVSDLQRVQQIINNLLANAFKFTPNGGVTMTISRTKNADHPDWEAGSTEQISISVSDTGIGIPLDMQGVIFEAFKQMDGTTSKKYGGTGLGLSISKKLATLLGGKIELQSEQGKGSTFTLLLPLNYNNQSAPNRESATIEKHNGPDAIRLNKDNIPQPKAANKLSDDYERINPRDKLLLVIEDDEKFAQILLELAHTKGYKCLVASNGESGLEFARKYEPDAILLDIGLPVINGWKVIEQLKMDATTKKIPVHVISGSEVQNSAEALNGIVGYLQKPVSWKSLDTSFRKIEAAISKSFKKLLIVDVNKQQTAELSKMLRNRGLQIISLDKGADAISLLKKESVDCMILDLKLKDMSGFELLEKLSAANVIDLPVIIHTEKVLTQDDETELRKYAESIIIKGSHSADRLVAEAGLFLSGLASKIEESNIKAVETEPEKEDCLKNRKILVVDDDMRNVFALTSVLEAKGMKVVVGRNGKEGMQKLDQNPDVNLILMDIMMPEMDGYSATREIRKVEKYRTIPIIILTAKAMKDDKQKCMEAGASDYLTKPLDIDKLISLIRIWLY